MISAELTLVTPSQAALWLTLNTYNRPIDKKRLAKYTAEMREGRWELNGQTISFDSNGKLHDGQHRLRACVQAGVPFKALVVFGVRPETFTTVDTGKQRSGADVLSLEGEKNSCVLSALISLFHQYEQGCIDGGGNRHPNNRERLEILEKYQTMRDATHRATAFKPPFRRPMMAFLDFMGSMVDPIKTATFMEQVRVGTDLSEFHPALHFRNRILGVGNDRKTMHYAAPHLLAVGIKALNSHLRGEAVKRISYTPTKEDFPSVVGSVNYGSKRMGVEAAAA